MNKQFHYLWIGQSLANGADILLLVSVMTIIYATTGKATMMAIVPLVITSARFLSGMLSPIFLDKYGLKFLLVLSQLVKTVVLFVLFIYLIVEKREHLIFIFTFMSVISFFDGWATPARNASIACIVEKEKLLKANSILATVDHGIQLGGWASGGVIVAYLGASTSIFISLLLFGVSTLCMMALRINQQSTSAKGAESFFYSFKEGWIYVWKQGFLRFGTLSFMFSSFANAVWVAAILYVFVKEILQMPESWWGYINASYMLGLLLSSLVLARFSKYSMGFYHKLIVMGACSLVYIPFLFGLGLSPYACLFFSMLFGVCGQCVDLPFNTVTQHVTPSIMLPKVYGVFDMLATLVFALATLVMGMIADKFGVQIVFFVASVLLGVSCIFMFLAINWIKRNQNEAI